MSENWILTADNIRKVYESEQGAIEILRGVHLRVNKGDFVSIRGASGAGKSTLLNILGALDSPTEGEVYLNAVPIREYRETGREHLLHRNQIGFIFQSHYLMPEFTLLENVMMPSLAQRKSRAEARKKAQEALDSVGLSHRLAHYPNQVSGGESQRAAAARVIAQSPSVILADEPTGNLDNQSAAQFMKILQELRQSQQLTLILVTHSLDLAARAERSYELKDGALVGL